MNRIADEVKRGLFNILGSIFLGIGCVGVVLPVLPTTPFLLLAAACYFRGSKRIHRWLITNRVFGEFIDNYLKGRGIKLQQKVLSIVSIWVMITISITFVLDNNLIRVILLVIAIAVSIHILKLPTYRDKAP